LLLPELFPDRFQGHRRRIRQARRSDRRGFALVRNRPIIVALLGAAITLALTPITPTGVPIVVAASAALIGLHPPQSTAGAGDEA
jgi:hypothetical protein